ncbi:C40 family peptidase [Stackebrandtia soli]|uniref:C40 family peptidase n=1 Tax=Stackebrandtia soli TaxID=1892856 RepID=UPI0039E903DC
MKITSSRRVGRVVLCLGTAAVLAAATGGPASADPVELAVPDDGSRPAGDPGLVGGDPVPTPGNSPVAGPGITRGPYANRIAEQARSVAELGEATTAASEDVDERATVANAAFQRWQGLATEAAQLADLAGEMATQSYQDSAGQVPGLSDQFGDLFSVRPGLLDDDSSAISEQAVDAAEAAELALASYDAALAAQSIAENDHAELTEQLKDDNTELEKLIAKNQEAIELQEKKEEADNERKLEDIGKEIDGLVAAEEAQEAVLFAVSQVGKPYVWGAEGPNSYDCSGLVQTAYAKQKVQLPRVANDQFRATRTMSVPIEKLLPGDLIFYGDRPGDWTSVYHVGMYIGDGQMVHAPRPGDVVKIVPVWLADFFGAHRVVEATVVDPPLDDGEHIPTPPNGDEEAVKPDEANPPPAPGTTPTPAP